MQASRVFVGPIHVRVVPMPVNFAIEEKNDSNTLLNFLFFVYFFGK